MLVHQDNLMKKYGLLSYLADVSEAGHTSEIMRDPGTAISIF